MNQHIVRAQALATEIAAREAELNRLRAATDARPFPAQKGRCRRSGHARPPRARLCDTCKRECRALKAQQSAIRKTIATLQDEHAIAIRSVDDLITDIKTLQTHQPLGWRARERVLELEINARWWDSIPSGPDEGDPTTGSPAQVSAV